MKNKHVIYLSFGGMWAVPGKYITYPLVPGKWPYILFMI